MAVSDHDIYRWRIRYGESKRDGGKAREMVEEMRRKGDNAGDDTWLRIIVAIGELGTPPADARR